MWDASVLGPGGRLSRKRSLMNRFQNNGCRTETLLEKPGSLLGDPLGNRHQTVRHSVCVWGDRPPSLCTISDKSDQQFWRKCIQNRPNTNCKRNIPHYHEEIPPLSWRFPHYHGDSPIIIGETVSNEQIHYGKQSVLELTTWLSAGTLSAVNCNGTDSLAGACSDWWTNDNGAVSTAGDRS